MAAGEIHVGDTPLWSLTVNRSDTATAMDLSGLAATTTARQIIFRAPDESLFTGTANIVGSGSNGALSFTSPSDLLDMDGQWSLQLRLALSGGAIRHSDAYKFDVKPNVYP